MCFEQWSAHILVQWHGEMVIEVPDSTLRVWCLWWIINWVDEKLGEPLQGILVHVIDDGQVDNSEKENLCSESYWPVIISCFINFFLCYYWFFHAYFDLIRNNLWLIKHVDKLIIVKNGWNFIIFCKSVKNLFLNVSESLCWLRVLLDD